MSVVFKISMRFIQIPEHDGGIGDDCLPPCDGEGALGGLRRAAPVRARAYGGTSSRQERTATRTAITATARPISTSAAVSHTIQGAGA